MTLQRTPRDRHTEARAFGRSNAWLDRTGNSRTKELSMVGCCKFKCIEYFLGYFKDGSTFGIDFGDRFLEHVLPGQALPFPPFFIRVPVGS